MAMLRMSTYPHFATQSSSYAAMISRWLTCTKAVQLHVTFHSVTYLHRMPLHR